MQNKKKSAFGSTRTIAMKDWSSLKDINEEVELPIETQELPKEEKNIEKNKEVITNITPKTKSKNENIDKEKKKFDVAAVVSKNKKNKGILFITEKSMVDKFYELCPKFYLKLSLPGREQNFSYVLSYLLKAMKKEYLEKYGNLLEPNEADLAFYKLSTTKGIPGDLNDIILVKTKLFIKMSEDDYLLFFQLLNTCFKNKMNKPGKYSVNYFFFEITRFLENNIKYFK